MTWEDILKNDIEKNIVGDSYRSLTGRAPSEKEKARRDLEREKIRRRKEGLPPLEPEDKNSFAHKLWRKDMERYESDKKIRESRDKYEEEQAPIRAAKRKEARRRKMEEQERSFLNPKETWSQRAIRALGWEPRSREEQQIAGLELDAKNREKHDLEVERARETSRKRREAMQQVKDRPTYREKQLQEIKDRTFTGDPNTVLEGKNKREYDKWQEQLQADKFSQDWDAAHEEKVEREADEIIDEMDLGSEIDARHMLDKKPGLFRDTPYKSRWRTTLQDRERLKERMENDPLFAEKTSLDRLIDSYRDDGEPKDSEDFDFERRLRRLEPIDLPEENIYDDKEPEDEVLDAELVPDEPEPKEDKEGWWSRLKERQGLAGSSKWHKKRIAEEEKRKRLQREYEQRHGLAEREFKPEKSVWEKTLRESIGESVPESMKDKWSKWKDKGAEKRRASKDADFHMEQLANWQKELRRNLKYVPEEYKDMAMQQYKKDNPMPTIKDEVKERMDKEAAEEKQREIDENIEYEKDLETARSKKELPLEQTDLTEFISEKDEETEELQVGDIKENDGAKWRWDGTNWVEIKSAHETNVDPNPDNEGEEPQEEKPEEPQEETEEETTQEPEEPKETFAEEEKEEEMKPNEPEPEEQS